MLRAGKQAGDSSSNVIHVIHVNHVNHVTQKAYELTMQNYLPPGSILRAVQKFRVGPPWRFY